MDAASALPRAYPLSERTGGVCTRTHLLLARDALGSLLFPAVVLSLLLAANASLCAQAAKSDNDEGYTVRGVVVNSVSHAAVAHALVFSSDNRYAKLTDDEGRFQFKVPTQEQQNSGGNIGGMGADPQVISRRINFAPTFMARKPGYLQSQNGQGWTPADGSSEIKIEIVPEALIVGRVNLPVNDGTERIQVQIYRRQVQDGRAQWVPAGSILSRANGEFRFANLQAGEYKLFTNELLDRDPLTFTPRGQLFGFTPAYFPAAADFETAAQIHLKAGETFSAALTPARREYYPVRIGVLNAEPGGGLGVEVETQGHRGPGLSLGYNSNESIIQGTLPNGNYSVAVTGYGEDGASGMVNFSVNGAPVQGIAVALAPNPAIEAVVKDERTKGDNTIAPGLRNLLNAMNVRFISSEEGRGNYLWLRPPKGPEDELLVFGNAHPASYTVRTGCHPGAYVAAVSSGGRDLLRQALVVGIGAAVPPLEITIRDDGAQVNGKIEDWPRSKQNTFGGFSGSAAAAVLFLPLPDSTAQFCQEWVNAEGDFNLPQVAPGDYRVIAFEHLPDNLEYGSVEAMKRYEAKGQVLRLVAGQTEHLRLRLDNGSE